MEKKSGGQFNGSAKAPEARGQIAVLEGMLQKEKEEFEVKSSLLNIKLSLDSANSERYVSLIRNAEDTENVN